MSCKNLGTNLGQPNCLSATEEDFPWLRWRVWLCVPLGSNSPPPFVASPIGLLDSLTLLLKCRELNVTTIPYLSHSRLFGITDCFNSSETLFLGTVDSSGCDNTPLWALPPSPHVHDASVLCGTQAYYLPTHWVVWDTCPAIPYPRIGVVLIEEPFLVPITGL